MKFSRFLPLASIFLFASSAHAQVARVTAIQQTVEINSGQSWKKAAPNAPLRTGDAVRTGKRSKADVKFGDGSLIRLSQLSSVEIRGGRNAKLTSGKLLMSALNPGLVIAGSAAAEIKGTILTVEIDAENNASFALYEGKMDVVTNSARQPLAAGQSIIARPNGTLSNLRSAVPLQFAGAGTDLLGVPQSAPFVGSQANVAVRKSPDRLAANDFGQKIAKIASVAASGKEKKEKGKKDKDDDDDFDFGNPFPKDEKDKDDDDDNGNGGDDEDEDENDRIFSPLTLSRTQFASKTQLGGPTVAGSATSQRVLLAQVPLDSPDAAQAADLADDATQGSNFLSERAQQRLRELAANKTNASGGDARLLGVLGDSGTRAYGARLHGYVARGNFLLDGAFQPLRVKSGGQSFDLTAISDLSLTYANPKIEAQLGRQRFLAGPTQATLFGSLVRQGGREIMDAARIAPQLGKNQSLELAYLVDAFPRNLPYRVAGRQKGFYARYAFQKQANFGFNILRYSNVGTDSTVGGSLDFALPLKKNSIDLYGEVGRDTFKRRLTTIGLSFPGLYEKTGVDLYLEYANVGDSSLAARPPTELALRAYRSLNDNVDLVGSLSRFSGGDYTAALGISVGSRIAGR